MDTSLWLNDYFQAYRSHMADEAVFPDLVRARDLFTEVASKNRKLMLAGNGASASIASHLATDFTKQGGVKAMCFNEANLITAFANDYGYEQWVARAIGLYGDAGDVAVLVSSSGKSPNMLRAAQTAREKGISVVTFSGFAPDNPLRAMGDINFWVDSKAYNIVECVHMIWLTAICDLIIGRAEYPVN